MKQRLRKAAPLLALTAAAVIAVIAASVASGGADGTAATSTPALLAASAPGVEIRPLISVGDKVGEYAFESIPDGIAVEKLAGNRANLYVNHETSLVPFPVGFNDVKNDRYKAVYSMGRHNHENAVAIPGYKVSVILSGDDTFSAPASQLYMYLTHGATGVMNDSGALYGFKSDDPTVNDYGDLSGSKSVSGTFIRVPVSIALGEQDGLERWSNENGIFQFIRVEDLAYDRNSPNIVYFADTGEPRALPDATTTRLRRGPSGTRGPYPNGRIFKLVLDKKNMLRVTSLSILIDGDAKGAASAGDISLIHNPDNVETTKKALLFQEDPGSQNQYAASNPDGTNARTWRYDLKTGRLDVVATANQAALDTTSPKGQWEGSGLVDASAVFGQGWFYTAVQAHTVLVQQEKRDGVTYKREAGQLLLVKIPGT